MDLNKKRKKYAEKQIKKYTKYIKKDIKRKYCRGYYSYRISINSESVIRLEDINIVNDIIEEFLKENNINYKKIIESPYPSVVTEINYIFIEVEDDK